VADLLEQAAAWLDGMRTRHASRSATYRRGSASVEVQATLGRRTYEVDDGAGALVEAQSIDFLVSASALVLDGNVVLPERGDRITVTQDGGSKVFEVTSPGGAMAHWEPSDPWGRTLRIHTKHVATET
jgi:hypothetical protein